LLLHAFKAFDNFCVRVSDFTALAGAEPAGMMFPAPENVALDGAPKIDGCGVGAALHASPFVHGGGTSAACGAHGAETEHSCAS
jgi:hypothetical protein